MHDSLCTEAKVYNVGCIRVINVNAHVNIVDFNTVFLQSTFVNTFKYLTHYPVAVQDS